MAGYDAKLNMNYSLAGSIPGSSSDCPTCGYSGRCSRCGYSETPNRGSHIGNYSGGSSENYSASIPTLKSRYS
jgi:hypothetical protein